MARELELPRKAKDKLGMATEQLVRDQLEKTNQQSLTQQYLILGHVPTLIFDILTKVSGDEHTFMVQDMS
jgi:hypothetical protein